MDMDEIELFEIKNSNLDWIKENINDLSVLLHNCTASNINFLKYFKNVRHLNINRIRIINYDYWEIKKQFENLNNKFSFDNLEEIYLSNIDWDNFPLNFGGCNNFIFKNCRFQNFNNLPPNINRLYVKNCYLIDKKIKINFEKIKYCEIIDNRIIEYSSIIIDNCRSFYLFEKSINKIKLFNVKPLNLNLNERFLISSNDIIIKDNQDYSWFINNYDYKNYKLNIFRVNTEYINNFKEFSSIVVIDYKLDNNKLNLKNLEILKISNIINENENINNLDLTQCEKLKNLTIRTDLNSISINLNENNKNLNIEINKNIDNIDIKCKELILNNIKSNKCVLYILNLKKINCSDIKYLELNNLNQDLLDLSVNKINSVKLVNSKIEYFENGDINELYLLSKTKVISLSINNNIKKLFLIESWVKYFKNMNDDSLKAISIINNSNISNIEKNHRFKILTDFSPEFINKIDIMKNYKRIKIFKVSKKNFNLVFKIFNSFIDKDNLLNLTRMNKFFINNNISINLRNLKNIIACVIKTKTNYSFYFQIFLCNLILNTEFNNGHICKLRKFLNLKIIAVLLGVITDLKNDLTKKNFIKLIVSYGLFTAKNTKIFTLLFENYDKSLIFDVLSDLIYEKRYKLNKILLDLSFFKDKNIINDYYQYMLDLIQVEDNNKNNYNMYILLLNYKINLDDDDKIRLILTINDKIIENLKESQYYILFIDFINNDDKYEIFKQFVKFMKNIHLIMKTNFDVIEIEKNIYNENVINNFHFDIFFEKFNILFFNSKIYQANFIDFFRIILFEKKESYKVEYNPSIRELLFFILNILWLIKNNLINFKNQIVYYPFLNYLEIISFNNFSRIDQIKCNVDFEILFIFNNCIDDLFKERDKTKTCEICFDDIIINKNYPYEDKEISNFYICYVDFYTMCKSCFDMIEQYSLNTSIKNCPSCRSILMNEQCNFT